MKDYKRKIIKQYLNHNLQLSSERESLLLERLESVCSVQHVLKFQNIESPGPASEGRIWYSAQAMIHSYYHNDIKEISYGHQIWKRNEIILFASSLLRNEDRIHYVQMLEPGLVISFSYSDAIAVRAEYPEALAHIEQIIIQNEKASQHRIRLLHEPSQFRVKQFEAENPLFCRIASIETKAMHVGLSRQGYSRIKSII